MFCSKCKTDKSETDFPPSLRRGKTGTCRLCHRQGVIGWTSRNKESYDEYRRGWAKKDREKRYTYFREYERKRLLKKYGVDQAWFDAQLVKQKGLCAICKRPETRKHQQGTLMLLSIDHSHKTNKVRGLLCQHCNRTLYRIEDSGWLQQAIEYLQNFQ